MKLCFMNCEAIASSYNEQAQPILLGARCDIIEIESNDMDKVAKIMDNLDDIEYGFKDENGINLINSKKWDTHFSSFYYLLSPEELLRKKCGTCLDQVELERELFNDSGVACSVFLIYVNVREGLLSHSFLTFELGDRYYWFEHSWYDMRGIHEYGNMVTLLNDVKAKFIDSRKDEIDKGFNGDIYIYKYDRPKYHISYDEFYNFIKTQERISV